MSGSAFSTDSRCSALPTKIRKLSPNARHMALCALLMVDGGLSAQQALATALAHGACNTTEQGSPHTLPTMPAIERNLCSELVYGYLRTEIRIAFILSKVLARPQDLPRPLQYVLGLAVYGLLFQDRVPDHAAVFSAVETARTLYGQGWQRSQTVPCALCSALRMPPCSRIFMQGRAGLSTARNSLRFSTPCRFGLLAIGTSTMVQRRQSSSPSALLPALGAPCALMPAMTVQSCCEQPCLLAGVRL